MRFAPAIECITEPIAIAPPPPVQSELFGGGIPQVLEMLPELERRFVTLPPKIRRIKRALGVDAKAARKMYRQAERIYAHREAHERYLLCKKYVDWRYSPEGRAAIERHMAERDRAYNEKPAEDVAHVVEIVGVDEELARLLDCDWWIGTSYQGPMECLASLQQLTRRDAEILLRRGCLRVLEGDGDTLLTAYEYPATIERRYVEPIRCAECEEILDYNIVGLNHKLGRQDEEYYRCLGCLDMSGAQARSIIERYKGDGCPLFV